MRRNDKNAIGTGAASGIGRAIAIGYARERWARRRAVQNKTNRPAEPEERVGAAVFSTSVEASYVTGVSLAVDGGYWDV